MYKHILIPTDGSALSQEAVEHGVRLAKVIGAKVALLTVTEPFHIFSFEVDQLEDTRESYRKHSTENATRILSKAEAIAASAGVSYNKIHVEADQPYLAIIRAAEEHRCDLIVMASHGRRGVSALVLGSETVKVLTHSAIPVLVCRLKMEATMPSHRSETARENAPAELV